MANAAKIKIITLAVAICSATLAIAPSAHAQGLVQGSLNQLFGNIQQEIGSGLMTPGQVSDIMRREANLQAEQQNLLMADGGVLTPNDQAKLFRDMQKLAQRTQNNMVNNGYAGQSTGVGGWISNLLGLTPATYNYVPPVAGAYGYPAVPSSFAYPTAYSGYNAYNNGYNGVYNNGYNAACNSRYNTAWNNGYHNGWREEARREHRRMERAERRTGIDFDHDGH